MSAAKSLRQSRNGAQQGTWLVTALVFTIFVFCGYGIGYLTKGVMFTTTGAGGVSQSTASSTTASTTQQTTSATQTATPQWPGDTIHSVFTSSGDGYQNFQSRIMYASYKIVQKMPGGEKLTGFTRILHRTVPDILMDEIPTFWAFPHKPQCDGWCDYPVANRPHAIKKFFDAVAQNSSMIQGAWIYMLEAPGNAWDPNVPNHQFEYNYIIPTHPNAVPSMKKLWAGNPADIPPSGPAPVLMRLKDWQTLVPEYLRLSVQMEADEDMKKALEWVREMYAWSAAFPYHKDIKIVTQGPPNSTTIVQPPFDEALGNAALAHYTWGALYHEGLPSKGGKQIYRWEKRDFNDIKYVLKVPHIPMPPEYKEGWTLEFDTPLTRKKHDLVVVMLTMMNKAIDTLPDLTAKWEAWQPELRKLEFERDAKLARMKEEQDAKAAGGKTSRRLLQSQ